MIAKRIFDLFFVLPGLLVLSPIFILVSILIKFDSNGPVFFKQERVGKNGQLFLIYKFRTMVVNAQSLGAKITIGKDSRITRIGSFLRKHKLDELPQLINVLNGEMSLVGPRPEVPEYVAYWPKEMHQLILSVPPGITDFASIEFRDENDMLEGVSDPVAMYVNEIIPKKLDYYSRYVHERSLLTDIRLILRTIALIIR